MAGARKRARDSDRDEAVHVISAAYSDGQISRQECDERSAQALKARTLGQLDALIRDLQVPGHVPQPATRRYQRSAGAFAALAVVVIGGLLISDLFEDDPVPLTPPSAAPVKQAPERINHFTAEGFAAMVDDLEQVAGTTTVFSVTMYPDYATALVPLNARGDRWANYGWDGTTFRGEPTYSKGTSHRRFDIRRVDGSTIVGSIEAAGKLLDGRIVDYEVEVFAADWAPKRHCYTVSVADHFSDEADLFVSCQGRILGHEIED